MRFAKVLPEAIKQPLRSVKRFICSLQHLGGQRYCPVCQRSSRKFFEAGIIPREDAQCIHCGAVERHRLVWLYFQRKTNLFSGLSLKMLHIAPEEIFEKLLRGRLGNNYLTADLHNPAAMVRMDIMDIQYPDESFDVIYCCHVLEHVPDDKKAMREFFRVLRHDGWAILLVPVTAKETFEDSSITEPAERLKYFGDPTHVRLYGPDYIERLKGAGFSVELSRPSDFLAREEIERMGITSAAGDIYYCTKQKADY
jgi:SAM-dependent methyltransferase